MSFLDLARLADIPLTRQPFDHLVVPNLIAPDAVRRIIADFPDIPGAGLMPLSALHYGGAFAELVEEIQGPALTEAFSAKFGLDLTRRPMMVTVRGRSRRKDGRIHTDSESKVISALIYLNEHWDEDGGRFRILNGPDDVDDFAAEVAPEAGTLAAFRRTDNSYHGHRPFVGVRRYVMFNWMVDQAAVTRELARHRLSAQVKRLGFLSRLVEAGYR
jgi:hypothetical protein